MSLSPIEVQLPAPCPGCWGPVHLPIDTQVLTTEHGTVYRTCFPDRVRRIHEEGCPLC